MSNACMYYALNTKVHETESWMLASRGRWVHLTLHELEQRTVQLYLETCPSQHANTDRLTLQSGLLLALLSSTLHALMQANDWQSQSLLGLQ